MAFRKRSGRFEECHPHEIAGKGLQNTIQNPDLTKAGRIPENKGKGQVIAVRVTSKGLEPPAILCGI